MIRITHSTSNQKTQSPARQWWYLGWIMGPIVALFGLLVFSVVHELRAKDQLQSAISMMQQRGIPVDNESLTEQFDATTNKDAAERWQRVCAAAKGLENTYWIPMLSDKWEYMGQLTPPEVDWKIAPVLQSYSQDAEPIIAELRGVLETNDPIWQPIIFEDINTLLPSIQDARSVARMLSFEFRAAFHAGDHQRAIQTLQLIPRVAEAIDYQNYLVVEFVRIAVIGVQLSLIRESMAYDYWTLDEIDLLKSHLMVPSDLNERWSRVSAGEATIVQDMSTLTRFAVSPVQQLAVLTQAEQLAGAKIDFEFGDLSEVVAIEREQNSSPTGISLVSVPLASIKNVVSTFNPAYEAYGHTLTRMARDYRWTFCALAIKQFQLQNNRWPRSLDELNQVGLSKNDWSVNAEMPFGYRVADDSSHALLWTILPQAGVYKILTVPPSTMEQHTNHLDEIEIRIHPANSKSETTED